MDKQGTADAGNEVTVKLKAALGITPLTVYHTSTVSVSGSNTNI